MGPFPLSYDFGMKAALVMLDRSLDSGRYSSYVQWETFRKARSAITNISQAGSEMLWERMNATGVGSRRSRLTPFGSLGSWLVCTREWEKFAGKTRQLA
jgi:hypothetical protein